jgi:hypothetical protein
MTKNIQAKLTDNLDHCQEQKYTCINDKTIYLIIWLQFIITQKQHNCDTETIYVFCTRLHILIVYSYTDTIST